MFTAGSAPSGFLLPQSRLDHLSLAGVLRVWRNFSSGADRELCHQPPQDRQRCPALRQESGFFLTALKPRETAERYHNLCLGQSRRRLHAGNS